jgi:hypothetical protein
LNCSPSPRILMSNLRMWQSASASAITKNKIAQHYTW